MKIVSRGITTNYDRLCGMVGNREFSDAKASSLADSIKRRNMLALYPVVCTRDDAGALRVIDGQHRIAAAKMLGIEVPYVVAEDLTAEDIRLLNTHQSAWLTRDYLHHFIALGNAEYVKLAEFCSDSKLPLMVSAALLSGESTTSGTVTTAFRVGKFRARNVSVAGTVAAVVATLRNLGVRHASGRPMVLALARIVATGGFDYEKFRRKAASMVVMLPPFANYQQAVEAFSKAYDYRSPIEQRANLAALVAEAQAAKEHKTNVAKGH